MRLTPRMWWTALETIPPMEQLKQADEITRWLVAARAVVFVMTFTSAALGGILAASVGKFDLGLFSITALGLVLAHAASNLLNDFWDTRHGLDTADSPRVLYGLHALGHKFMGTRELLVGSGMILLVAAAIGGYLTLVAGPLVAFFAVAGAAILFFYAGDPLPLKFVGLGELAVLIVWGPLMVGGTYYVLTRDLPAWVIIASLPYALGVTTVLLGKHLDKIDFDRRMRVRTLPVVIGEQRARWLTIALTALMYLSTLYLVLTGAFLLWLLLVALALPRARNLYRVYSQPRPKQLPEGYTGGPLWFVSFSFLHNRRFGALYIGGWLLHVLTRFMAG